MMSAVAFWSFSATALAASFLVAPEPCLVLLAAGVLLYIALLSGVLVVAPPPSSQGSGKVFCIGLSRTGTTSISVALHELGLRTHHQCHSLVEHDAAGQPRASRFWADAFDAHSDIAPATVFEELAEMYPDARFVLTQREPRAWGKAMIRFVTKNAFIFRVPVPNVARMFSDVYGEGWPTYTVDEWAAVYEAHERRVARVFASAPHRLLRLRICDGEGWEQLCPFLRLPAPPPTTAFPRADVFELSAGTQVVWQLSSLRRRFGRLAIGCLLLLIALRPVLADHNQCMRACRVANGHTGAPAVLGDTGDWYAATVSGRRLLSSPGECECYATGQAAEQNPVVQRPRVPRLHRPIETVDQWHFKTSRVCGTDGAEYRSAGAARRARVDVANCGQCSRCSSVGDIDAMHARARTLTGRASLAAIVYLLAGETAHRWLMRSPLAGFDAPCAECWLAATQCNLASCAQHCLYGWNNPLSASSTVGNSTELNACMRCDELHCSAYFLQACGANRRTAGVVSDINRPSGHVCDAARRDAIKRMQK